MTLAEGLLLVGGCLALVHIGLRASVITLLHRIGKFGELGAPRDLNFSDALPARAIALRELSDRDQWLVRTYFVSWVAFLSIPLTAFYILFSG